MSYDTTILANAFYDSAGIDPSALQLGIRSALLLCILIWAIWVVIGTVQAIHHPDMTGPILIGRLLSILVMVMGILLLATF